MKGRLALRIGVLAYLAALLVVPLGWVVWKALSPGISEAVSSVTSPEALHALQVTMISVAIAVPINAVFGLGVALILARHRFFGSWLLGALVDLPLAVSPVIIGLALLLAYGRFGWIGSWLAPHGISLMFSIPGIVMACAFVSLPYVTREVLPLLRQIGTEQEQAASTLGASSWSTFWRITVPSIRWGLAYGITLTTARVLGEIGAVAIVSGNIIDHTETMTLYVQNELQNFDPGAAYAGSLLLALIAIAILGLLRLTKSKEPAPWPSPSNR